MTNDHGYPPMTPEERALFARVGTKAQTDDDLIAAATFEADHALRSLPPHCLPAEGGLPHNPDHANACAHRCWSFLKELAERRANRVVEPVRSKWLLPTPNCRGCGKPIVLNETIADACPCNAPRGVNHGLVPTESCTCPVCDPAQTGSARKSDGQSWAQYMPSIVRAKPLGTTT